jgi:serine protease AprX
MGFQWAIDRHSSGNQPLILSNSWGIYQESWAPDYARNVNHPFTRKVKEAVKQGIIVLFAAGNCGPICPSMRCGGDIGTQRSIWGANGLAEVLTVGAANIREEWICYSSVGPAALDEKKPDFCSISQFKGFHEVDTGTSTATPVAAAVVALLKGRWPNLGSEELKSAIADTCRPLCSDGWDFYSGAGILNAEAAYAKLKGVPGGVNVKELCEALAQAKQKLAEGMEIIEYALQKCGQE